MKLLIFTQKVDKNDSVLGFFHSWLLGFAKHCEKVTVICLQKGEYNLPNNVRVLSLGKENNKSRVKILWNFYYYIWQERKNYDAVFVHMNPIYVILGGFFWRIMGKKIALWYTHKNVDLKLRLAEKITNIIFTASRESFRLDSDKLQITGHGIDTDIFRPVAHPRREYFQICSVARISEAKNQKLMIDAMEILKANSFKAQLHIVGSALAEKDRIYEKNIREIVKNKNLSEEIIFSGNIVPEKLPNFLQKMNLLINLSSTGSMDKAVLEAMACGLQILTSNEAFAPVLTAVHMTDGNPKNIATKIESLSKHSLDGAMAREYVVQHHNLLTLIPCLIKSIEKL
jgi:glycosyltransferase involved in cell wall biosynthesis